MNIFSKFKDLFTLSYYSGVCGGGRRFNPFLSLFLLALLFVIQPAIFLYTQGYVFAQGFESQVTTLIERVVPGDLEIRIKDGAASTNVQEPYYVYVSPEMFKGTVLEDKKNTATVKTRLLAIDTKARAEDFKRYQAAALLTERSIVYYNDGDMKIYPLRNTSNAVINKEIVQKGVAKLFSESKINDWLKIGVLVLPWVLLVFVYVGYVIMVCWYALLVFLMMKIYDAQASYTRAYSLTAAVMFVPYIVVTLLRSLPTIPAWATSVLDLKWLFILGFAYCSIHYLYRPMKSERKG